MTTILSSAKNLHTAFERRQVLRKACTFTTWENLDEDCKIEFIELAALIITGLKIAPRDELPKILCDYYGEPATEINLVYFDARIYEATRPTQHTKGT